MEGNTSKVLQAISRARNSVRNANNIRRPGAFMQSVEMKPMFFRRRKGFSNCPLLYGWHISAKSCTGHKFSGIEPR
jgi:hypothetical protein